MNSRIITSIFILSILILSSCVKDDFIEDFVDPEIRITSAVESLALGDSFQFEYSYFNNIGQAENVTAIWESSDESIISITPEGLAETVSTGEVVLTVTIIQNDMMITNSLTVSVGAETVISSNSIVGTIVTTTFYVLEGTFELVPNDGDLLLNINEDYQASSSLPGLYIYLSNNKNSIAGAKEIGEVTVFRGQHSYTIENTDISDFSYIVYFCKPFNVKVGEAKLN